MKGFLFTIMKHIFVKNRHTTPVTKKDISYQEVTNMSNNYEQNNQNKYNNSYDESENSKNSQNKQNSQNQNKNQSNNREQNKSC